MQHALTPKGEATRARLVEGAARLLRERPAGQATLGEVEETTGASDGQLLHYFPGGLEELLVAVARFEADRVLDEQQPYLDRLTSWDAWDAWRDAVLERYRAQDGGSPLGALLAQLARSTPGARAVAGSLVRCWQERLATGLREMRVRGLLPASFDVDEAAAALLAGVQGGVAIMLATGDAAHLEAALDVGLRQLRAAAGRSG